MGDGNNFETRAAMQEVANNDTRMHHDDDSDSSLSISNVVLSLFLFFIAGVAEIGGGYLIWKAIRERTAPYLFIPLGSVIMIAYGFIPTLQPLKDFGRVFAIYGGFFIALSYIWGYIFDGLVLDKGDFIGTSIALVGVFICWFWPR